MNDTRDMTIGEAEAWRAGFMVAAREWFAAIKPHVYHNDSKWAEKPGWFHVGRHGDSPVDDDLNTLLSVMEPPA